MEEKVLCVWWWWGVWGGGGFGGGGGGAVTLKVCGSRRMHCELHSLKGKYVEALFQIEPVDFIEQGLKEPFSTDQSSLVDFFHR